MDDPETRALIDGLLVEHASEEAKRGRKEGQKPNTWNCWPDLELIRPPRKVEGARDLFALGQRCGQAGVTMWLRRPQAPAEVIAMLDTGRPIVDAFDYVTAVIAGGGGQEVHGLPGIDLIVHPGLQEFAVVVPMGPCKHEITSIKLGNCYHECRCSKCDYWYRVDSGD